MGLELYDLENDISEKNNVAEEYPEIVTQLEKQGVAFREKLGDQLIGIKGSEVREPGRISE